MYLLNNKSGVITGYFTGDYKFKYQIAKLIDTIESNGWEDALKNMVQKAWQEREESVRTERKRRY